MSDCIVLQHHERGRRAKADFDIRLILKHAKAEPCVIRIAEMNDWDLRIMGNRKAEVYVDKWITSDGRAEIHYVEDPMTGLPFVTFRGEGSDDAAQLVGESCHLWAFQEALDTIDSAQNRDDRLTAIYAATLTAPEREVDSLVETFRSLATDPDPGVRQSVVVATGYLPWPALVELVQHLAETDPVDHVRHNAQVLLEGFNLHGDAN
ncbi:HEAT repeat domain-containing protein [Streptomyces sp. NPDC002730]|uniref:HEAT repeat domain-containing protein n=1 Tax=Streptomyces sp. NPDC002730 TaxID=3364662 RepID=UPI0036A23CEB